MSSNNPYSVVNGPDYGAGLVNWGQMGGTNAAGAPNQQQAGAPKGGPMPVTNGVQGQGQPTQQQQQMQGLGQRLAALLGLGGAPAGNVGGAGGNMSPSVGNPTSLAPQQPAPQPPMPVNPASPYGLY